MRRHFRITIGMAIAVGLLAVPAAAQAAGEFCTGHVTTIFGTNGPDSPATGFVGTSGDDVMFAFRGDDIVHGAAGDDQLCGSKGEDEIDGQDGHDGLYGGDDDDAIRGSAGRDVIYGLGDNDIVSGGRGIDYVDGGSGADRVRGGSHSDALYGGTGDDVLNAIGGGADQIFGDGGVDTCRVDELDTYESCEIVELVS